MDVFLIAAVLVVVVVLERRRAVAGRVHVARWADENDMRLTSCRYRYLRLYRRPQFVVNLTDATGRRRRGIATVAGRSGRRTRVDIDDRAPAR